MPADKDPAYIVLRLTMAHEYGECQGGNKGSAEDNVSVSLSACF
jgi:hypothetical protein